MTPDEWILHDPDPHTRAELKSLSPTQREYRFRHPLRFGTAGLRGPLQAGPSGMNLAVVLRTSWAIGQLLHRDGDSQKKTVIVGYDARHHSQQFACGAAEVLAAEGFRVIALPRPLPTPVVAFGVRNTSAVAGIQITASHNPATDNGYKVYDRHGRQILSPLDHDIEALIEKSPPADLIPRQLVLPSGEDIITAYINRSASLAHHHNANIRIALTALHGVGGALCCQTLQQAGFKKIQVVACQQEPNPDFPTIVFPNPEEPATTDRLLQLAANCHADIAFALDPDADRCAVGIPTRQGWRMLTGNEVGWLLGDYILSNLSMTSPQIPLVATTHVSSRMLKMIAQHYHVEYAQTPTGFKWLSRADDDRENRQLIYAYEEAIGYCVDPIALRDKDGISTAVLLCSMVASLQDQHHSLEQQLDILADRFGVHHDMCVSHRYSCIDDLHEAMEHLHRHPWDCLGPIPLHCYSGDNGELFFRGNDQNTSLRLVVRPSGTEPKIKCYVELWRPPRSNRVLDRKQINQLASQVRTLLHHSLSVL